LADRGKSAARVDWQQAFLLIVAFGFELARPNSAHVEAFNAELRTRAYTVNLFQTKADIELAPFFDLGKVSHEFTQQPGFPLSARNPGEMARHFLGGPDGGR
jgi:hypothetical protein